MLPPEWVLSFALPHGARSDVALFPSAANVPFAVPTSGGALAFKIPDGQHLYLTSNPHASFASPPAQTALALEANQEYSLSARVELAGGTASLWLIEYADERLCHQNWQLRKAPLSVRWKTHASCRTVCLAVRLAGTGSLALSDLRLAARHEGAPVRSAAPQREAGPAFGEPSIFFDPSGYRRFSVKHQKHYDDRAPSWYAGIAKRLSGCKRVLDVGCGPGLLLSALALEGVAEPIGLERDEVYLAQCRERGVHAIAHDLNEPAPFLESASFDGIVAHQTLDYCAPIAIRTVLRECMRVLEPGGKLLIISRTGGQGAGDVTRTVALDANLWTRLLTEAGFSSPEIERTGESLRVLVRKPVDVRNWPTRTVALASGRVVHPWVERALVLPSDAAAWNNNGDRDFTLLTDAHKRELRVAGALVGYYTGYRQSSSEQSETAICRAVSIDGVSWKRQPSGPVLEAGAPGAWDDGGVAAGSVLPSPDGRGYVLYYSGKTRDRIWAGIGIARSDDGIHWRREPAPILTARDYGTLKHLALADVIQTSSGRWLMHCEGWVDGRGWAIYQAESDDGLAWRCVERDPVLDATCLPWAGTHIANPKCLELESGQLVLGVNAADASFAFQLCLAESSDQRTFTPIAGNPVVCATTGDYRIESFFMTRDAWERGDQRVYFFRAATRRTEVSSSVLTARADSSASWVGGDWKTTRAGLYRVREDRLLAEPGAAEEAQGLTRSVPIVGELQCTFRFARGTTGGGALVISVIGDNISWHFTVRADGQCLENDQPGTPSLPDGASCALRILRPESSEVWIQVWDGERVAWTRRWALGFSPRQVAFAIRVPPGEPAMSVDFIDVWSPEILQVENDGDAHVYAGGDSEQIWACVNEAGLGRALALPRGDTPELDTFDQICDAAAVRPGVLFPVLRHRSLPGGDDVFERNQLEVLWQAGKLFGLAVDTSHGETPSNAVLEWCELRNVLVFWFVRSIEDVTQLETRVLSRTIPVVISSDAPPDEAARTRILELLGMRSNLYATTAVLGTDHRFTDAIHARPHQILFGSASSAAAHPPIANLAVPESAKRLVRSENLRFLTERAQWRRWEALRTRTDVLFPPLPRDTAELAQQGFEIVAPDRMPPAEFEHAKEFWSQYGVRSFYQEHKPWASLLVRLVRDLKPRSVLEFGCNVGRNLYALREAFADIQLVGLDINEEAVRAGREAGQLDLRVGDERTVAAMQEGEFDLVFTVSVLDHMSEIGDVTRSLVRCARRNALFLEVTLPVEGKVTRHFDHKHGEVRPSTGASYSWDVTKYLAGLPRVTRVDRRPIYMHAASLGPYYSSYLAYLK